jgi:hypothetical protein
MVGKGFSTKIIGFSKAFHPSVEDKCTSLLTQNNKICFFNLTILLNYTAKMYKSTKKWTYIALAWLCARSYLTVCRTNLLMSQK